MRPHAKTRAHGAAKRTRRSRKHGRSHMPKKGERKAKVWPGDPSDATGFVTLCAAYLDALRVQNYSEKTIESREHHLREFVKWAHER